METLAADRRLKFTPHSRSRDIASRQITFNGLSEGEAGFAVCKMCPLSESRTRETRTSGLKSGIYPMSFL